MAQNLKKHAIRPITYGVYFNLLQDMKSLKDYFQECIEKSAENNPVILVLDSLDQLSIDDGGRQIDWYPRQLPDNVYTILSTLPGQEYQALPSLRVR